MTTKLLTRALFLVATSACLLLCETQPAQAAASFVLSVTANAPQTELTITGGNFCAPFEVYFPALGGGPLAPISSSASQIKVAHPAGGAQGNYLFAVKCGPDFTYYVAALDPETGPTLGANTFTGTQTAPLFVGSGAGLTNLPAPAGVALLSANNNFTGNQTITGGLHVTSDVVVDGNIGAKYQDVAEWVDSVEPLAAGTVVVIDPLANNRVRASRRAYATSVAGAISAQPGVVLGQGGEGRVLVAQSGRVRIKADARFGAIKAGDLLVSSPVEGYAMRSRPIPVAGQRIHRPGTVLGKALESLPKGKGEILVLLTLQ